MQQQEETIDLHVIKDLIIQYRIHLAKIMIGCILLALVIAFLLPAKYESTTLLRVKNQPQNSFSMQAAAMAAIIGGNITSPTQAYIEMLKSRSVLEPVINELDLPEKEKEEMTRIKFAKKYLDIKNAKGTDLIEVTASGKTPEEARHISAGVVSSFQKTLTRLNQSDQSMLMQFLKERLTIAKKEMEQAEGTLEQFRQDVKVYVPQEQAKGELDKLAQIDQQVINLELQNKTNDIKLQTLNQQLEKQNIALRKYNLADNETIQKMREKIVAKHMDLVEMTQRYTDKHPNVEIIRKEIEGMEAQLKKEVEHSIIAETNTLNPIHASLLKSKIEIESALLTGGSMEKVMRQAQEMIEKNLSDLSANSLTYVGLERQVRISQEVYSVLVKNYEQARMQETMESMDFQIVDEAELPKEPSWPKKLLFLASGLILGMVVSLGWLFILYNRQEFTKKGS